MLHVDIKGWGLTCLLACNNTASHACTGGRAPGLLQGGQQLPFSQGLLVQRLQKQRRKTNLIPNLKEADKQIVEPNNYAYNAADTMHVPDFPTNLALFLLTLYFPVTVLFEA